MRPEPRLHLVACMVSFSPALRGNLAEGLERQLRRVYPHVSAPRVPSGPQVFYSDPDKDWAVWFTHSAIGLEAKGSHDFGEFHHRLGNVVRVLGPGLDADLYTRLGLRCVYSVPPSLAVSPRPLPPHLSQVFRWSSKGGHAYLDFDVFAEDIKPVALDERLEEIIHEARRLSPGEEPPLAARGPAPAPGGDVPPLRPPSSTAVAAFPELVSFDEPPPAGLSETDAVASERAELLARKYSKGISSDERKRLDELTARLDELLPPVSVADLEALVEMAEETERIRKDTQELRQRLGLH